MPFAKPPARDRVSRHSARERWETWVCGNRETWETWVSGNPRSVPPRSVSCPVLTISGHLRIPQVLPVKAIGPGAILWKEAGRE